MKVTRVLKAVGYVILFLILTLLSQVGGVAYIFHLITYHKFKSKIKNRAGKLAFGATCFMLFYSLISFLIVPLIAGMYGRERLPLTETKGLKPATVWIYILNRNYVRIELKEALEDCIAQLQKKYPGTTIHYLDGTFPLFANYALFPHFSHKDGRKLDLSFIYYNANNANDNSEVPSWCGYGVCEGPKKGEVNMPADCDQQGYWQYSILEKTTPQNNKKRWLFDQGKTRYFIELLARDERIKRMFIEPHLASRMQLNSDKIKLHGCRAVRHDDHLHIEMSRR